MATVVLADNAYGTLGGALASTASSITFTAGHGARFPAVAAGQALYACLLNANNVLEEIQITTHTASADTANVVRAIGGTTAKAWNSGDRIECRISSTAIRNLFADPLAVTGTGSSVIAGPLDLSGASAGQISFPGTQNPSTATNVFDDYEEGSWTPGITFASGTGGITYGIQQGSYTKIGNRVFIQGYVALTSNGTSTGQAQITGLPITPRNQGNLRAALAISANNLSGISGSLTCQVLPNDTSLTIGHLGTGAATNLNDTHVADNANFMIGGTYEA